VDIDLDKKRQEILQYEGHILVNGGPGSGKTTIALLKVKMLFQLLLPGQKLLFLSFSRAAVRQVLLKCQTMLTYEERRAIEVKTYHAFCLDFLKSHGRLLTGKPITFLYPTQERLKKSKFSDDWGVEQQRLAIEEACFCFDILAYGTAELLERSEALRKLYADCYPMVIVDEFQDTDDQQWRIIKAFIGETRIFCLADPEQSIFQYRKDVNPHRIQIFQDSASPQTFDLGNDNHRSPNGNILSFADAILRNNHPLPTSGDVKIISYPPSDYKGYVHAAIIWTFETLQERGVETPTIAVLARSNAFVATISNILTESHRFNGHSLSPVDHGVVWDEELSLAAAVVVASIMEWSAQEFVSSPVLTVEAISRYYELKNAISPSKSAQEGTAKYYKSAQQMKIDGNINLKAVKELLSTCAKPIQFVGNPIVDWRNARQVLYDIGTLQEIFRSARMVRMFGATDVLGAGLSKLWLEKGNYSGAALFVERTLQNEQLISEEQNPEQILLMNIHKSKGKEFDGVVLVEGMRNSLFIDTIREKPPYTQSRRLLRVGITRAKKLVTIVQAINAMPLTNSSISQV
jgi:DNA helicase II / ATP-dependent DNA helicase PcrA